MPEGKRIISVLWHYYLEDMSTLKLEFLVIPTYNTLTLGVADASTYPAPPTAPTIEFTIPGVLAPLSLPFVPNDFNIFNSTSLGLTVVGADLRPLPDGVWIIKYSVSPAFTNNVTHTIMRTDQIQEKFDNAFMKLDMMECDLAIKTQSKVQLNSIYYLIQGSIAAANNSAVVTANKLYAQADRLLNNFIRNNCGCTGNNYIVNFQ
jgi:hypothetical protein